MWVQGGCGTAIKRRQGRKAKKDSINKAVLWNMRRAPVLHGLKGPNSEGNGLKNLFLEGNTDGTVHAGCVVSSATVSREIRCASLASFLAASDINKNAYTHER